MLALIVRRLMGMIPVLFLVSIVIFSLQLLLPGDPAVGIGGEFATPEQLEAIRQQLRLDQPAIVRYFDWVWGLLQGDLGTSLANGLPISGQIFARLGVTAQLALLAVAFASVVGIAIGVTQSAFRDRWPDNVLKFVTSLGMSIPGFYLAGILVLVFAVNIRLFPPSGFVPFTRSPVEWFSHLVLPTLTLGVLLAADLARLVRAGMLRTAESDYVRTAYAKGLPSVTVLGKHELKNAMAPVIAIFGVTVAHLLAGAVLIEHIFTIPGLGAYTITAISTRDLPVIQAVAMLAAVVTLLISLLVDILLAQLNPKVRISG